MLLVVQGAYVLGENDSTENKNYDKIIEDLSHEIELNPNDYNAYCRRGEAYFRIKQYAKAVADYSHAIKLKPNIAKMYECRGFVYFYLKQYDKTIEDYSHAIKLDPNNYNSYCCRGWTYFTLKQYAKSVEDFSRAIKLDPNNYKTYYNRGAVYSRFKQYDKAIEDYSRVIKLDPNNYFAYCARGMVYSRLKQYGKAIINYSKALVFIQNDKVGNYSRVVGCYLSIMEVFIITGKIDSFQSWLKKFETSIPENKLSKDHLVIKLYLTLINKCIINDSCTDTEKRLDELFKDNKDIKLDWSFELTDEWLNNPKNGLTSEQIKYIEDLTKRIKAIQKS